MSLLIFWLQLLNISKPNIFKNATRSSQQFLPLKKKSAQLRVLNIFHYEKKDGVYIVKHFSILSSNRPFILT
jgi:hypothetical protein